MNFESNRKFLLSGKIASKLILVEYEMHARQLAGVR